MYFAERLYFGEKSDIECVGVKIGDESLEDALTVLSVNVVELMQFTGRLDKNKIEVYEGDNVKCKDLYTGLEFTGTVEFQDCSFVIKNDCATHYRWMDYEVEVVGNVWEDEPNKQKGRE